MSDNQNIRRKTVQEDGNGQQKMELCLKKINKLSNFNKNYKFFPKKMVEVVLKKDNIISNGEHT